jgi:hypothetical protein
VPRAQEEIDRANSFWRRDISVCAKAVECPLPWTSVRLRSRENYACVMRSGGICRSMRDNGKREGSLHRQAPGSTTTHSGPEGSD